MKMVTFDRYWFDDFEDRFERIFGFTLDFEFNYLSIGYLFLFTLQIILYFLDAYVMITDHGGRNRNFNFVYVICFLIYLLTCITTLGFLLEPDQRRGFRIGTILMTIQLFGSLAYFVHAHFLTETDKDIQYLFHYTYLMAPYSLSFLIILLAITTVIMWNMTFLQSESKIKEKWYIEEERVGNKKSA